MKMRSWILAVSAVALSGFAHGQSRYILRYTESVPLAAFLAQYQLELEATVNGQPIHSVVDPLLRNPDLLIQQISDDTDDDVSVERDQVVQLPILDLDRYQSSGIRDLQNEIDRSFPVDFFRRSVPSEFVRQRAVSQAQIASSWYAHGTGSGIVAVIDTRVDRGHSFFRHSLVPGIDYLDPSGDGSELRGLSDEVLALINPTTTPLLGRRWRFVSKGHSARFEPSALSNPAINSVPLGLGHGTMVAGAIRLVAPNARILPIRAFGQSGTGRLFHVIQGIHDATARNARVINLSLNTYVYSPELERTTAQVSDQGVILVASTGNDGLTNIPSYPASLPKVTGVASVNTWNRRSLFSNAGADLTWVSAPGEAVYLPFLGQRWAAGWGTSFSAPLVSGLAAKVVNRRPGATYSDLQSALGRSLPLGDPNLGHGSLQVANSMTGL